MYAAGAFVPFLVLAGTYAADLVLVLRIRTPLDVSAATCGDEPRRGARRLLADVSEGFRFLWRQASLRAVLVFAVGINLCSSMFYVGLNLRLVSRGVAPVLIGTVDASASVGAFLGALAAGWIVQRVATGRLVGLGSVLFAATWVPLSFTGTHVPATCALSFVAMLGIPAVNAALMGFAQAVTPDDLQGRVTSASSVLAMAAQPVGPLLAGLVLTAWGPVAVGLVPALAGLTVSVWLLADSGVRSLGRPDTWSSFVVS